MNLCDKGVNLLKELTISRNDIIPPYNSILVNEIIESINKLYQENEDTVKDIANLESSDQDIYIVVRVKHLIILWNKRCLLAYQ